MSAPLGRSPASALSWSAISKPEKPDEARNAEAYGPLALRHDIFRKRPEPDLFDVWQRRLEKRPHVDERVIELRDTLATTAQNMQIMSQELYRADAATRRAASMAENLDAESTEFRRGWQTILGTYDPSRSRFRLRVEETHDVGTDWTRTRETVDRTSLEQDHTAEARVALESSARPQQPQRAPALLSLDPAFAEMEAARHEK